MRRVQPGRAGHRTGFTLIELLVVIAIIGLLIGLLIPAVQKIRKKGPELRTSNEITEISKAHQNFLSTYTVEYIPTCWWITNDYAQTTPAVSPALADSRQYYSKVWPKAFIANAPGRTMFPPNSATGVGPSLNIQLDGNQVLLLLLGGIPPGGTLTPFPPAYFDGRRTGFLNSPTNPFCYNPATKQCTSNFTGENAQGPFYDFDSRRIDEDGHYHDPHWSMKPSDKAKNFYYYFSHRNGNDYGFFGARYGTAGDPFRVTNMTANGGYGGLLNVDPFRQADGTYYRQDSFQLISPGADGVAGRGGLFYVPGQNEYAKSVDRPALPPGITSGGGFDDQANFGSGLLGRGN